MIRWLLLLCLLLLISCSEYVDDSNNQFTQSVYMVPEGYSGDYLTSLTPLTTSVVENGQTVKFIVSFSLDGQQVTSDSINELYKSILWEIDGQYFNLESFRYTFKESGIVEGKLTTVDTFDDTLVYNFQVYVNTSESITLDFPYDGYNQAEPAKEEALTLEWTLTGIDSWETAECNIFLSTIKDSLWNNQIGSANCNSNANLWGPLIGDTSLLKLFGIDVYNTSYTFYWGIQYVVKVNGNKKNSGYSNINTFSTKILNDTYSIVEVPIKYKDYDQATNTTLVILNAYGDTLQTINSTNPDTTFLLSIEPQSGIKLHFSEQSKLDFSADSLLLDLPLNTYITTDTVYFKDKIPPQINAVNTYFHNSEQNMQFLLYDDGTGINENSLEVLIDTTSTEFTFESDTLQFDLHCSSCTITINAKDYSENSLPDYYWSVTRDNSGYYTIEGPYPNREDQ